MRFLIQTTCFSYSCWALGSGLSLPSMQGEACLVLMLQFPSTVENTFSTPGDYKLCLGHIMNLSSSKGDVQEIMPHPKLPSISRHLVKMYLQTTALRCFVMSHRNQTLLFPPHLIQDSPISYSSVSHQKQKSYS